MKEKLEQFSKGVFEYEQPYVYLSEDHIEFSVASGKVHEGSFEISNSTGKPMKGIVNSSNRLFLIQNPYFSEAKNVIHYQFDAQYLKPGERIQGEVSIISNCGEQILRFDVEIEAPYYMSSIGKIKDLFQFTNLARMDWSEAKKIFRSEDFERIFLQSEEKYRVIYRNLVKSISTSQALEEFLIAIHKKSGIRLNIDKAKLEYTAMEDKFMDKLILTKDQWGYVEIKVGTDADFIQFEQKYIWGDFFLGNTYPISFTLDPKKMRFGNNFGRIWIKTVHQTIEVEVICRKQRVQERQTNPAISYRRMVLEFQKNYLKFRLNQIDLETYLKESFQILQQCPDLPESRCKELFFAHLAIVSGNQRRAELLLDKLSQEEEAIKNTSVIEFCAYLYLKALYDKQEETIRKASDIIRGYYEKGHFDWRLLWFLLNIDYRYKENRGLKLLDIKEQFQAGCHSPVLYYEAACIYNEEPYLLHELKEFEVQVLNYSIKNSLISNEVTMQYAYLANKKKHFHPILYRGLVTLYERFETTDILTVICCMLIKGIKKSPQYHKWYRLAVEKQLRITELYEYFMYSIDETMDEPLPQAVLLYFIYNSNLNDRKKAYLYASIFKHKNVNESIYQTYYKKIEVFAEKQLEAHHISNNLAILYEEILKFKRITPDLARHLPYVMYRQELVCHNPNIVGVIVIHEELGLEENIPLNEGRALIDIYSDLAKVFLIDSMGNRYCVSMDYSLQALMKSEDYEEACMEFSNHPKLLIHLFNRYQNYRIVNDKAISIRKKILKVNGLKDPYYYDCLEALVDYYYEYYNDELLEYYLSLIDLHKVRRGKQTKLLEYLVKRGFYDKVLDAFETYGYEDLGTNLLVKFCSGWLAGGGMEKRLESVIHLCHHVFHKGKYDEAILNYLVRYFYGSTREMFRIWTAAKGFEVETHDLEERLLAQMLFTEGYVQDSFRIFHEYYKNVTNHILVRAFLSFYAYKYLIHDWVIHNSLFPIMRRELNYEENDLCLLAWLKYNKNNRKLSENDCTFIEVQIQRLVKKGIILPFFEDYRTLIKLPERILDKSYVEYRTDPKKQVFIHYRMLDENCTEEYVTERMTNVFMGIHVKEFTLFYHEILQYYITEEFQEDVLITESYQLRNEREPSEDESRYNQINLMLMAKEMHDEATMMDLMEHYATTDYLISKCFQPLE